MFRWYQELCSQHLKCDHPELSLAPLLSLTLLMRLHRSMLCFAGLFFSFSLAQDFEDPYSNDLSETLLDITLTERVCILWWKGTEKKMHILPISLKDELRENRVTWSIFPMDSIRDKKTKPESYSMFVLHWLHVSVVISWRIAATCKKTDFVSWTEGSVNNCLLQKNLLHSPHLPFWNVHGTKT